MRNGLKTKTAAFLLLICLLPLSVNAVGPTDLNIYWDSGEWLRIYDAYYETPEEDRTGHEPYSPYNMILKKDNKIIKKFKKQYCGFDKSSSRFSCEKGGSSPIAGVTYAQNKWLKKCRGTLYICKQGCGPDIPREMIQDPWECYLGDDYIEPCQKNNNAKSGHINANSVNVRSKPSLKSKVLSRLDIKEYVLISKRIEECVHIDAEMGEWVKIQAPNVDPVVEGWVYDAFVEYSMPVEEIN